MNRPERSTPQPPSAALLDDLAAIVGDAYAIRDPADMAAHLVEPRRMYSGKAAMVLRPGTVAEVSRILALANETRTPIVPQGGNTGLVGGQIPFDTGHEIVLSLSRLNRIRNVDARGNTMIAEAGVILANAQKAADEADRLFPLSLGAEGSCQIGGNLGSNAGGVGVLAYGNARELTLGLEVVLADGRVWGGLRGLRKDNTGYDLKNLFIGSEGTLGVITAAVLKLFPKPTEHATAVVGLDGLEDIARLFTLAQGIANRGLTAFEMLPRLAIDFVLRHGTQVRDPLESEHPWYALLEISGFGTQGEAEAQLQTILERALSDALIRDAAVAASIAQADGFWRFREQIMEVQIAEGGGIKHDVSVPVACIPEFVSRANALVERLAPDARPLPFGHFGDGNVHYNVMTPAGGDRDTFLARWDEISGPVHDLVLELGGSVSAEHGIGRLKRALLAEVKSEVELDLMRRIKSTLDPNGILNPGKVL